MSRGVNKVILIGNLGNDPEVKYTQGGMCICSVSLATSSSRKDKDGNTQERTEWHRVKFFGKLAEVAAEYLRKGSQIYVEGKIQYEKWTGDDGVEKYFTDILADQMTMLGGKPSEGGGSKPEPAHRQAPAQRREPAPQQAPMESFEDDDIPF